MSLVLLTLDWRQSDYSLVCVLLDDLELKLLLEPSAQSGFAINKNNQNLIQLLIRVHSPVSVAVASSDLVDMCEPFVLADSSNCDKHLFDFVGGNSSNLRRDDAMGLWSPC